MPKPDPRVKRGPVPWALARSRRPRPSRAGTLSGIVGEPDRAHLLPAALDALHDLRATVAALAVISGRAQADLERLVDLEGVRRLGDYGQPAAGPPDPALARFRPELEALLE